jgi:hypothetical protein
MNSPNNEKSTTRIELGTISPEKKATALQRQSEFLLQLAAVVVVSALTAIVIHYVWGPPTAAAALPKTITAACATPRDMPPLATPVTLHLNDSHGDDLVTLDVSLSPNYKSACDVRIESSTHPLGASSAMNKYLTAAYPIEVSTGNGYSHSGIEVSQPDYYGLSDANANLGNAKEFTVKLHVVRSDGTVSTVTKSFDVDLAADGRPEVRND